MILCDGGWWWVSDKMLTICGNKLWSVARSSSCHMLYIILLGSELQMVTLIASGTSALPCQLWLGSLDVYTHVTPNLVPSLSLFFDQKFPHSGAQDRKFIRNGIFPPIFKTIFPHIGYTFYPHFRYTSYQGPTSFAMMAISSQNVSFNENSNKKNCWCLLYSVRFIMVDHAQHCCAWHLRSAHLQI